MKRKLSDGHSQCDGTVKRSAPTPTGVLMSTRVSKRLLEKELLKSVGGQLPLAASQADASRMAEKMVDENGFLKDEECLEQGRYPLFIGR